MTAGVAREEACSWASSRFRWLGAAVGICVICLDSASCTRMSRVRARRISRGNDAILGSYFALWNQISHLYIVEPAVVSVALRAG